MSLRTHRKSVPTPVVSTIPLLIIAYGKTYLAVPADVIRGILKPEQVRDDDVLCFLGVTYPFVDLADRLGLRPETSGSDVRVILCSDGNGHCAFKVDQVIGLVEVTRPSLRPLPPQFRGAERRWFGGLFLFRDVVALVLNPKWLLGEHEEALVETRSIGEQSSPYTAADSGCPRLPA